MNDTSEAQSFSLEYDLPHPPAKVWRALTEPALLSQWLMDTDLEPRVGKAFTFKSPPSKWWDGIVNCEVLEIEPQKRLRYTWKGGPKNLEIDTVVTWTLTPTASGTRLGLVHSGFATKDKFAFEGAGKGWTHMVQDRLGEVLAKI